MVNSYVLSRLDRNPTVILYKRIDSSQQYQLNILLNILYLSSVLVTVELGEHDSDNEDRGPSSHRRPLQYTRSRFPHDSLTDDDPFLDSAYVVQTGDNSVLESVFTIFYDYIPQIEKLPHLPNDVRSLPSLPKKKITFLTGCRTTTTMLPTIAAERQTTVFA